MRATEARFATSEDWRILRALSLYRLILITLLLVVLQSGYGADLWTTPPQPPLRRACIVYALTALLLVLAVVYRTPRGSVQVHLHFAADLLGIGTLVYFSGGVSSGFGILLITSAVSCALLLTPRLAVVQAAGATLAMFGEEIIRQSGSGFSTADFTSAGLLGLMFFATSSAASAVALRARKSEALAIRVGSEFADLSQLNESIIESMHTGVVVVDGEHRIRSINAAGTRLLGSRAALHEALKQVAPRLNQALDEWISGRLPGSAAFASAPGAPEIVPRFSRLGFRSSPPILILLDDAATLREHAQQMKLAALGRLSASIAHEIRNPLAAITHAGQLLAESLHVQGPNLPGENQRLLAMIARHSARIEKIVKEVLHLSKRDAAARTQIPLKQWLVTTAALYQEGYPNSPRPIELLDVDGELAISFDPNHFQQVLFNLWDNSFEHGGGDTAMVLMHAGRDELSRQIFLECADNGGGIAPSLHDKMFEPFFTTSTSGTGLGLYLSRELCEYNSARLTHLPQDRGAVFRIYFSQAP